MVAELIDKYVWLIQTLINAGSKGLSLRQLERKWENRYNENYPRRTFNNHREAIAEVFGIEIECDRSTNTYYISADELSSLDSSHKWLINTFTVGNLLSLGEKRLRGRVSVEDIPSGQFHLTTIMQAMDDNRIVIIDYKKYTAERPETLHVAPYAVRECERRWYLVGYCQERKDMRVYGLDRIKNIEIIEEHFELAKEFDVEELFANSFGAFLENKEASSIEILASETEARYLRDLPLHHSQREDGMCGDKVVFRLRTVINFDMILALSRLGDRIEITAPDSLRKAVYEEHKRACRLYENNHNNIIQ